ncbi:MAG: hypothetical protein GY937_07010 [bacterium]|nr:hypothetical protein [bacterium]
MTIDPTPEEMLKRVCETAYAAGISPREILDEFQRAQAAQALADSDLPERTIEV